MSQRLCLIEGDGIGREVIPAARRVLEAMGLPLIFTEAEAGWETFQRTGVALPDVTIAAAREADATLFGAVSSPSQPVAGYRSPIVALRRELGLFANVRPTLSQPVPTSRQGIDFVIVRENTEDLYVGREHATADEAVAERVITRAASERITRAACELALRRRGLVTIVHKANVLRTTCGLFREAAFAIAGQYAVRAEEMLVDACALRLITEPERFDVIVTTNLFGDILSDEAAALVGGLRLAPAGNSGEGRAVFEPVHGSAPDIAGQGIANPIATFLACAMMLDFLNRREAAGRLRVAIEATLRAGVWTPDLGGQAHTKDVTTAVIRHLEQ